MARCLQLLFGIQKAVFEIDALSKGEVIVERHVRRVVVRRGAFPCGPGAHARCSSDDCPFSPTLTAPGDCQTGLTNFHVSRKPTFIL